MFPYRIKELAFILLIIFFSFILLEVILHVALGRAPQILYEPHANYLAHFKPNMDLAYTLAGNFRLQTNAFAFRDDRSKYDERPKIIVYGDSNIAALFAPIEETFPRRLENYLKERFTVINAGVPGFGPDQSFLRMQDEIPLFKPTWVILHVFADNDYGDLLRNNLFVLNANRLERTKRPMSDQSFGILPILRARFWMFDIAWQLRQRLSKFVTSSTVKQRLAMRLREYEQYREGRFSPFLTDDYDFDVALLPNAESSRYKVQLMERILEATKQYADRTKFGLLVLLQPSSSDLTMNLPSTNFTLFSSYSDYRPTNLTEPIAAFCRARGIHFVDLYPIFAASNPETLYFYHDNNHWNVAGMDLAARVTASYLTENKTAFAR